MLWFSTLPAYAVEVNVVGLFSGKALVEINGGKARVLSVGQSTPEGVKLISAGSEGSVFEINGERRTLQLGQSASAGSAGAQKPTVTLIADSRGHFIAPGSINGASTQFLVDTGATAVSMSAAEARRLGISYLKGQAGYTATAGGVMAAYRVTLNSVRIGDITLNQVDGIVIEGPGMSVTLLGMSFLSRVEMKREGSSMTLVKQY
ncbi:MAG: TIGR02281 family clan AA aspartic protease [Burkholderiales bacterium]|nr:TIGR02281 family clan AA aspartic protease [Burkholderiales bacterium]